MPVQPLGPGGWTRPGCWTSSRSPGSWGAAWGGTGVAAPPLWVLPARVLAGPPGGCSRPMPTRTGIPRWSGGWPLSRRCAGEGSLAAEADHGAPQAVGEGWRACGQSLLWAWRGGNPGWKLGAGSDELPFPSQRSGPIRVLDFRAFQASPTHSQHLWVTGDMGAPGIFGLEGERGSHPVGQNLWA